MSYGEQGKYGGCFEMYGDLAEHRILEIKLGCYYTGEMAGVPVASEEVSIDEKALLHSLFQISNSAKERILGEIHKWSFKDGDLGVTRDLNKDRFPMEEEYEHDELNESF